MMPLGNSKGNFFAPHNAKDNVAKIRFEFNFSKDRDLRTDLCNVVLSIKVELLNLAI